MKQKSKANHYLIALISFSLLVVTANILMVYLAHTTNPGLIEADYYKKGINYDKKLKKTVEINKLGYYSDIKIIKVKNGLFDIEFYIYNKLKQPAFDLTIKGQIYRASGKEHDSFFEIKGEKGFKLKHQFKLPGKWTIIYNVLKSGSIIFSGRERIKI